MIRYDEQKEKVHTIVRNVSEKEGISWSEARTMVHKYVCEGKCSWYRTKSGKAGFNREDSSAKQKKLIEETVKEIMKDLTIEEAKWHIHNILCPGHPRPRPVKNCGLRTQRSTKERERLGGISI